MSLSPRIVVTLLGVIVFSHYTLAKLTIDVLPSSVPAVGDKVTMTCNSNLLSEFRHTTVPPPRCELYWSRVVFDGSGSAEERLVMDSSTYSVKTTILSALRMPYSTTLTIASVSEEDSARYYCHLRCNAVPLKHESVHLEVAGVGLRAGFSPTMVAGTSSLFVISALLIAVLIVSCYQHKFRTALYNARRQMTNSRDGLISEVHEDDCECEECAYHKPPPRYSEVVNMETSTPLEGACNTSSGEAEAGLSCPAVSVVHRADDFNAGNGAVSEPPSDAPAPFSRQSSLCGPPDYRQALELLAQHGIVFDAHSLSPMPPAYQPTQVAGNKTNERAGKQTDNDNDNDFIDQTDDQTPTNHTAERANEPSTVSYNVSQVV